MTKLSPAEGDAGSLPCITTSPLMSCWLLPPPPPPKEKRSVTSAVREETAEVNEEEEPRRESHLGLARRFLGHDGAPSSSAASGESRCMRRRFVDDVEREPKTVRRLEETVLGADGGDITSGDLADVDRSRSVAGDAAWKEADSVAMSRCVIELSPLWTAAGPL